MSSKKQRCISPHVSEREPGLWSNCMRVGDTIWLSGFTARADDLKTIHGGVIFTRVKHCLEAAQATLADVVNMTIYVTDMADNKAIWEARREFFSGDFPCSTLVQVAALGHPDIKVEITCQAVAGCGD